ncbi:MAG: FAD-binding oxidoreductase [Promicromonosporaceae bacterium]|nr:FAD-binding oxidoreductase [Promicromonosporaceae bacterium]
MSIGAAHSPSTSHRPAKEHSSAKAHPPTESHRRLHEAGWRHAFGDDFDTRAIRLAAVAPDASHVERQPAAYLIARDTDAVARAMKLAVRHRVPLTFRAGGTSLSGQSGTDGVLVDTRRAFRTCEVLDDGERVRCGPGVTIDIVNAYLAPYGRVLGSDPASHIAACLGGVIANNSAGMSAGTVADPYRTLESLRVVLPSGTVVDTSAPDADAKLRHAEPKLYAGLVRLRDQIHSDPESLAKIAAQYTMKNTLGYGLNSFVDYESPVKILEHLMVGSEGTLGFISEAVIRTVPILPFAATALLVFEKLTDATDALEALVAAGATTLELLDAASIAAVQPYLTDDDPLKGIGTVVGGSSATALLVEVRAADVAGLAQLVSAVGAVTARLPLVTPANFTEDPAIREKLWEARHGLYTIVAGARPAGTTALLEDVAVPVAQLSRACAGLQALFAEHGFNTIPGDGVIFGHAKDGNIHFMIILDTSKPADVARFAAFTEGMVDLILGLGGTLKAEHGTGRIMAPFVARQFGEKLYAVMREVKELFDPKGILNPGTIINDDPQAHLRDLKQVPVVDEFFDRCVECGFCEPWCPSRDLTLTPRQRLAVLRALATGGPDTVRIRKDWIYWGVETCAADSMCAIACPVDIDTGKLMKRFRAEGRGPVADRVGVEMADHFAALPVVARVLLTVCEIFPRAFIDGVSLLARKVLPTELMPRAGRDLPGPGTRRRPHEIIGSSKPVVEPVETTGPVVEPVETTGPVVVPPIQSGAAPVETTGATTTPSIPNLDARAARRQPVIDEEMAQ